MKRSVKQKFVERCQQLIKEGERIKETREPPPPFVVASDSVNKEMFYKWKNNSENLIIKTTSSGSSYHRDFSNQVKVDYFYQLEIGIGILKALLEDLEQDFLEKVQDLVIAGVFTDFLDTASVLDPQKEATP